MSDGSEHRSSHTYADRLDECLPTLKRDSAIDAWMKEHAGGLGAIDRGRKQRWNRGWNSSNSIAVKRKPASGHGNR
jgi:hypothetical protein